MTAPETSKGNAPVCAIVGIGKGLGMGIAHRFAEGGYKIGMIARNREALLGYESELEAHGAVARGFSADAGDEEELVRAFRELREALGAPSVLIYNAAVVSRGVPSVVKSEDLLADFKVNVVGAVVAVQQVLPEMRKAGKGTILLTGGGFALYPQAPLFSLGLGKAGIRNLTSSLADELEGYGIRVGTVTVCGTVAEGTRFAPDKIAEAFFGLHMQKPGGAPNELLFK